MKFKAKLFQIIFLLAISGVSLLFLLQEISANKKIEPQQKIIDLWTKDLKQLKQKMPDSWQKVSEVEVRFGDESTKSYFTNLKSIPIQLDVDGEYKLVLTVFTAEQKLFISGYR